MHKNMLYLKIDGNLLEIERTGFFRKTLIIKYNDEPVFNEKIGVMTRGSFDFEVMEEGSVAKFQVNISDVYMDKDLFSFQIWRDGSPILLMGQGVVDYYLDRS